VAQAVTNIEHNYVVVTPVRNEAEFVGGTIDSMVAQTVQPSQWIIVDDGSTDETAAIVHEWSLKYPWICLVSRSNRGFRKRGGGVVEAFNEGYAALTITDYQFIVKLDGDVSFAPDYFERLLTQFANDSKLGIAGGTCYIQNGDAWVPEETGLTHVRGATKVYRRTCFESIGGLTPYLGWDGIDEWQARARHWQVQSFLDLPLYHYRPTGTANGAMKGRIEQGQAAYYMGYHPLFMLIRSLRRMADRPFVLGGLGLFWGYLNDWLHQREQVDDLAMIQFLRQSQLQRLGLVRVRQTGGHS